MASTQAARVYRPRQAQQTIVHQVVNEYLPELIEQAEQGSYSLPEFVEGELQAMLRCGEIDVLECARCGHRPIQVVSVIKAPTVDQLAAVSAASSQQVPMRWPRRSRAPPLGQMQFSFVRWAA